MLLELLVVDILEDIFCGVGSEHYIEGHVDVTLDELVAVKRVFQFFSWGLIHFSSVVLIC
jgi:hypothetical protein